MSSNDPLARIKPGPPCPSCGHRISLRALQKVCNDLRTIKNVRGGYTIWGRKSIQVSSGSGGSGGGGGGGVGGVASVQVAGDLAMGPGSLIGGQITAGGGSGGSGGCGSSGFSAPPHQVGPSNVPQLPQPHAGGNVLHDAITTIDTDSETCARCGTVWEPTAQTRAQELEDEIRKLRLELESAVDLLGRVAEN